MTAAEPGARVSPGPRPVLGTNRPHAVSVRASPEATDKRALLSRRSGCSQSPVPARGWLLRAPEVTAELSSRSGSPVCRPARVALDVCPQPRCAVASGSSLRSSSRGDWHIIEMTTDAEVSVTPARRCRVRAWRGRRAGPCRGGPRIRRACAAPACTWVHVCACAHVCACMWVHMRVCMCVRMYMCAHVCMCMCARMCMCAHVYARACGGPTPSANTWHGEVCVPWVMRAGTGPPHMARRLPGTALCRGGCGKLSLRACSARVACARPSVLPPEDPPTADSALQARVQPTQLPRCPRCHLSFAQNCTGLGSRFVTRGRTAEAGGLLAARSPAGRVARGAAARLARRRCPPPTPASAGPPGTRAAPQGGSARDLQHLLIHLLF